MGLLDIVNRKQLPTQPLLGGATEGLGILYDMAQRAAAGLDKKNKAISKAWDKPKDEQAQREAYQATMDFAGLAPLGLTVWHGSPHKFTKFDMSKIGTGEGAQAFGHGLYVAESPQVANSYANALQGQSGIVGLDQYISSMNFPGSNTIAGRLSRMFGDDGTNWDRGSRNIESIAKKIKHRDNYVDIADGFDMSGNPIIKNSVHEYIFNDGTKFVPMETGWSVAGKGDDLSTKFLYKVDIPDEAVARMLDWDKPVADAIRKPASDVAMQQWGSGLTSTSGEHMYNEVVKNFEWAGSKTPKDDAVKWLTQQGIPGIRYLDGGSRGAGGGTSNYVLFSDQLPRILEVNGQPTGLLPWGKGEWQGLLD